MYLRSWAASPAFEWKSLPQMQHACPVDVARVCLLPWARWCSTRRFPSMHPIDLLTDALQLLLLEAASSQVSGQISVFFMCLFSTSLKRSFCPPCFLFPSVSSPYKTAFGSLESDMRLTCPAQRSCDTVMSASALGVLALLSTSISGTLSGSLGFDAGGSLNRTLYFQIWWIVACNCEIDEILSCGECWSIHQNLWAVCWIFWRGLIQEFSLGHIDLEAKHGGGSGKTCHYFLHVFSICWHQGRIISIKELSHAHFPCLRRSLESFKIKELAIRPCPNIDSFTEVGSHCFQNWCQVECEESGG